MSEKARIMTLEEVETSDYAYLLYEIEDPKVRCFLRVNTFDEFISFLRHGDEFAHFYSQPHLWKKYYGSTWVAYTACPDHDQINIQKAKLKREIDKL